MTLYELWSRTNIHSYAIGTADLRFRHQRSFTLWCV